MIQQDNSKPQLYANGSRLFRLHAVAINEATPLVFAFAPGKQEESRVDGNLGALELILVFLLNRETDHKNGVNCVRGFRG
jgi:hypothetical protein